MKIKVKKNPCWNLDEFSPRERKELDYPRAWIKQYRRMKKKKIYRKSNWIIKKKTERPTTPVWRIVEIFFLIRYHIELHVSKVFGYILYNTWQGSSRLYHNRRLNTYAMCSSIYFTQENIESSIDISICTFYETPRLDSLYANKSPQSYSIIHH